MTPGPSANADLVDGDDVAVPAADADELHRGARERGPGPRLRAARTSARPAAARAGPPPPGAPLTSPPSGSAGRRERCATAGR